MQNRSMGGEVQEILTEESDIKAMKMEEKAHGSLEVFRFKPLSRQPPVGLPERLEAWRSGGEYAGGSGGGGEEEGEGRAS